MVFRFASVQGYLFNVVELTRRFTWLENTLNLNSISFLCEYSLTSKITQRVECERIVSASVFNSSKNTCTFTLQIIVWETINLQPFRAMLPVGRTWQKLNQTWHTIISHRACVKNWVFFHQSAVKNVLDHWLYKYDGQWTIISRFILYLV